MVAPPIVFKTIGSLQSQSLRQTVRGITSRSEGKIQTRDINRAFRNATSEDFISLGFIIGHYSSSLYPNFLNFLPKSASELFSYPQLTSTSTPNEVNYQIGRLLANKNAITQCIPLLIEINSLLLSDNIAQCTESLKQFINVFGYSALIIRKCALIKTIAPQDPTNNTIINDIITDANSKSAASYFYLCESLYALEGGYIATIRYWSALAKTDRINSPRIMFRHTLRPNADNKDILGLYVRASGNTSALDTLVAIANNIDLLPNSAKVQFSQLLDAISFSSLSSLPDDALTRSDSPLVQSAIASSERDTVLYQRATAFLEHQRLARWRGELDREILPRLLPALFQTGKSEPKPTRNSTYFSPTDSLTILSSRNNSSGVSIDRFRNNRAGSFLRSAATAAALNRGERLHDLDREKLLHLLEITQNLSALLTEEELRQLYTNSSIENEHLIAFLAMIMLNRRIPNDDNRFDLTETFQELVLNWFNGDIIETIKWIHKKAPELTPAVVDTLDTEFLSSLYMIFTNIESVRVTRRDICAWAYESTGDINYELLANRLTTELRVSEVTRNIDSSRIYVVPSDFKRWAEEVLAPLVNKYRQLKLSHIDAGLALPEGVAKSEEEQANFTVNSGSLYYLALSASVAYREFCNNSVWGVSAYLSRRIRHGTMVGHLEKPVWDEIVRYKDQYPQADEASIAQIDNFFKEFQTRIADLRDKRIQFKSEDNIFGLFDPNPMSTVSRKAWLTSFLRVFAAQITAGQKFSTENLFDYCWGVISSDFPVIQKYILRQKNDIINNILSHRFAAVRSADESMRTLERELKRIISAQFDSFSLWFTKPEDVVSTALVHDLCLAVEKQVRGGIESFTGAVRFSDPAETRVSGQAFHDFYDLLFVFIGNVAEHGAAENEVAVDVAFDRACNLGRSGLGEIVLTVSSSLNHAKDGAKVERAVSKALAAQSNSRRAAADKNSGLLKVRTTIERQRNTYRVEADTPAIEHTISGTNVIFKVRYPVETT